MRINFPNYVETIKLPSAKVLYPLFEAISNSIDSIEERKVKDGKMVDVPFIAGGLIYCHVICDFTKTLRDLLKNEEFLQVGNEDWFIHYHQTYNAFIEVKSFEFVLETSTKRNQILFDELGLN
ncbi:MAG: hypothetical protein AB9907_08270 [Flexilinea sp.]